MSSGSNWDIVTVTYNSEEALQKFWNKSALSASGARWIVIDNNSRDDSAQVAESLGAEVKVLDSNLGFATANNLGFRMGSRPFVLFANPDLQVGFEDLTMLQTGLANYPGIMSPQLLNEDLSLQINGRGLPYLTAKMAHRGLKIFDFRLQNYLKRFPTEGIHEVSWFMGASLASTREAFQNMGAWNERFFIYYEDHEIGLRAKSLGFHVTINNAVLWRHGWARESKSWRLRPLGHELANALRFYSIYPKYLK